MTIHAEQQQDKQTRPVVSEASGKQGNATPVLHFMNNRPESVAQQQIQTLANKRSEAGSLKGFHEIAQNSPHVKQLRQSQTLAHQFSIESASTQQTDFRPATLPPTNHGSFARGTVQRVQWDTVHNSKDSYKTEIFGGVSWRKYQVKTDGGSIVEVFKGENRIQLNESESSLGMMMRREDNDGLFNCHGFTFGGYNAKGGPFGILDAGPVKTILQDEYTLSMGPSIGCVVIFGDADHSGIVEEIKDGQSELEDRIMVKSKLGTKGFSVESVKDLNRFGKASYYTKGVALLLEDEIGLIELQAQEIEERAAAILKIEKGVSEIKRLQMILDKVTKGGKLTEEERQFLEEMRQEANARKLEKEQGPIQRMAQLREINTDNTATASSIVNNTKTGLPNNLKSGIENLSGYSMNDVKVHYNSAKPAQLQAHAYAQGTDIHLAPGQEKHLPHEAWHVVQQKQGRVKPTMQLKGKVPINDDVRLEKEADEMGAKAVHMKPSQTSQMNASTNTSEHHPVQRQINLGIKQYTLEEVKTLLVDRFPKEDDKAIVRDRILPALDLHNQTFKSAEELYGNLLLMLGLLKPWYKLDPDISLKTFIQHQMRLQSEYNDLQSGGFFKYLMTTTGFEHEFSDMVNSPFVGLSHIELAVSTEKMPLTKIPFIVETDAGNALELVSPPFLLPTVKGVPLPDPAIVGQIDELMRKELSNITPPLPSPQEQLLGTGQYKTMAFGEVMDSLAQKTGLSFVNTDLKLKPEHISHNVDPEKLAPNLEVIEEQEDETTFDVESKSPIIKREKGLYLSKKILDNIQVGKSKKASGEKYNVSSQVNFATDLDTAALLMEPSTVAGAKIYRDLETLMATAIQTGNLTQSGTKQFSKYMVKQLCSLFSVYSQTHLVTTQKQFYQQVDKEAHKTGTGGKQIDGKKKTEFNLHAGLSSYVKDASLIWVKDHLESIAAGTLKTQEDFQEAFQLAQAALGFVKNWALPDNIKQTLIQKDHSDPDAHWENFLLNLLIAIPQLLSNLEENGEELANQKDETANMDLYGHDPDFIGARQDTYLDPKKVKQSGLWDSRLYVAEIRRGNPGDQLKKAALKI